MVQAATPRPGGAVHGLPRQLLGPNDVHERGEEFRVGRRMLNLPSLIEKG